MLKFSPFFAAAAKERMLAGVKNDDPKVGRPEGEIREQAVRQFEY